jgi:hypothetical protein
MMKQSDSDNEEDTKLSNSKFGNLLGSSDEDDEAKNLERRRQERLALLQSFSSSSSIPNVPFKE